MFNDLKNIVIKKRILLNENVKDKDIEKEYNKRLLEVANYVSQGLKEYKDKFYELMREGIFLPNSPCLVNAGRKSGTGQLAACFVLDIEDSIDSIYRTLADTAKIHKSGGGTGFNFSKLRPKNCPVNGAGGVASGPVSFMRVYDKSTEEIKQGGVRRGANIGILEINHPDIIEFIRAKENKIDLKNFNLSVAIKDDFMQRILNNELDYDYELYHKCYEKYKIKSKKIKIKKLWQLIIDKAYHTGDPGLLFIDRMNNQNTLPSRTITGTNPCGEVPLASYEMCCLGSLALPKFVKVDSSSKRYFDFDFFRECVKYGVYFLNQILNVNKYPLDVIKERMMDSRKIGLGLMGLADLFLLLGMRYGSEESLRLIDDIMRTMFVSAYEASVEYAKQTGIVFRLKDDYSPDRNPAHKYAREVLGLKKEDIPSNSHLISIAPTGTLSILAECSSGIEPIFSFETIERRADSEVVRIHPIYKEYLDKVDGDKSKLPEYFVTAHSVDYEEHIKVQAAFQKWTDLSISKTINFKKSAKKEDIERAYKLAYELGCKGITVYRDGSLEEQAILDRKKESIVKVDSYTVVIPRKRPNILDGRTYSINTGLGALYVTVNYDPETKKPFEVFCNIGKSGSSERAKAEAVGRLVSLCLRAGLDIEEVLDQIEGIMGQYATLTPHGLVKSIPDAVALALRYFVKDIQGRETKRNGTGRFKEDVCPECGGKLKKSGSACKECINCGYKSCGE